MKRKLWKRTICLFLAISLCITNITGMDSIVERLLDLKSYAEDISFDSDQSIEIQGIIEFKEESQGGIDWTPLVRPSEFNEQIKIKMTYDEGKYEIVDVQEYSSRDNFFLAFKHDGNGAGNFTIKNVPKTINVDETAYPITEYEVFVKPSLPYYTSSTSVKGEGESNVSKISGTIEFKMKTQTLNIQPTVNSSEPCNDKFEMSVTFSNNQKVNAAQKTITKTISSGLVNNVFSVPVGIDYNVKQTQTPDGYKFNNEYAVTDDNSSSINTDANGVTGKIEEDKNITIQSVNYSQNKTVEFEVQWIDNNSISRPNIDKNIIENNKPIFVVEYSTNPDDEASYKELTDADDLKTLDMNKMPVFNVGDNGKYYFSGLSSVDEKGNAVSYRVSVKNVPQNYISAEPVVYNGITTFTFAKQDNFVAHIVWRDEAVQDKRPDNLDLKLYRRTENGNYEIVSKKLVVEKNGSLWTISVPDLQMYDNNNHEYDYVLVQGSIDNNVITQTELENGKYTTYYNNGSGSFGNDKQLCHNGGYISEVLCGTTDFTASKEWKDGNAKSQRPDAEVVLWRYVKDNNDSSIKDAIRDAIDKGKAAQVVYYTTDKRLKLDENGKEVFETYSVEHIISHSLNKNDEENFEFKDLPKYDGNGREYVYFVRENLNADAEKNYEAVYSEGEGASNHGKITNVKREKAAVSVQKIWINPNGLKNIDGSSIQLKIKCPNPDNPDQMDELTVYSSVDGCYDHIQDDALKDEQSATGFTETISLGEVTYYVNIYDNNGKPYDMSKAVIEEIFCSQSGTEYPSDLNGLLDIGSEKYQGSLKYYGEPQTLGNGMKLYKYIQTNTITAERDYILNKTWDSSIPDVQFANVESINFRLERCSYDKLFSSSSVNFETVSGDYTIYSGNGRFWTETYEGLPKYNNDGYEYLYRATEVSFNMSDGTVLFTNDMYNQYGWSVDHYRTPDATTANNYIAVGGYGYFTVSKLWQDNGDSQRADQVKLRIYNREKFKQALMNQQALASADDSAIADIDSLDNFLQDYLEVTLNESESFTKKVTIQSLLNATKSEGRNTDESYTEYASYRGYIVLEYKIGSNGKTAEYTYDELKKASLSQAGYGFSGEAEILDPANTSNNRKYEVSVATDNAGDLHIVNKRTGVTQITAAKQWNDGSNSVGARPDSIQFQLYKDGAVFTDVPKTVTLSSQGGTALIDNATGIVTLNGNTADNWTVTVDNLPMFSETGSVVAYSIEELPTKTDETLKVQYFSKKVDTVSQISGAQQNITFNFSNIITGTTSHKAYKIWNDAAIGASHRPDLYFKLYRYLKKDMVGIDVTPEYVETHTSKFTLYEDYLDQKWTILDENATDDEKKNGYYLRVDIDNLPRFDEYGNEYGYVFTESMNKNGDTVYGTYKQSSEVKTNDADSTSYEVFTNTIVDYMTVKGEKTWNGLSNYKIKNDDLPNPTIKVYRTTDKNLTINNKTPDEINQLILGNKIVLADEAELYKMDHDLRSYSFPTKYSVIKQGIIEENADGEKLFPKYDSKGNMYYYLLREEFDDKSIVEQLYVKANDSGNLVNTFKSDINRRNIKVTKYWDNRNKSDPNEDKYPTITFELYRYTQGKNPELYDKKSISAKTFDQGIYSCTFNDLLIYSPKGEQYFYYVTENTINGYVTYYYDDDSKLDTPNANNRIDVTNLPANRFVSGAENINNTAIKNVYTGNKPISLTGEKIWNDFDNNEKFRPDRIEVSLKRYTASEPEQNNQVDSALSQNIPLEVKTEYDKSYTSPYIVWTKDENKWTYTIYNLEQYAQNGLPYTYTLKEENIQQGYKDSGAVSQKAPDNALSGDKQFSIQKAITNSYTGEYTVRKNWIDGYNKYYMRPTEVTVVLQRAIKGTASFSDMLWTEAMEGKLPHGYKRSDGAEVVSVKLDDKCVVANTKNSAWQYTFTNLPTRNNEGKEYEYRCVEVLIGDVPLDSNNNAGAYTCSYEEKTEARTVIDNTLSDTSLYVEKEWLDDENDMYGSRPDSLTFKLQKKGYIIKNGELTDYEWRDVINSKGKEVTFTITKADDWKKTLEDLPAVEIVREEDGTSYTVYSLYYRAVEVYDDTYKDDNSQDKRPKGALNYNDVTVYSSAHSYDDEGNKIKIQNRLIVKPQKITVNKKWYRDDTMKDTAVFDLLYRVEGSSDWYCYCGNKVSVSANNTITSHSDSGKCLRKQLDADGTVSWSNLPQFNLTGEELEYLVVEHSMADKYETICTTDTSNSDYTEYNFTNIETQSYKVNKIWQNTEYSAKTQDGYTAAFVLQSKTGDGEWSDVPSSEHMLTSEKANDDTQSYEWKNLPKYDANGNQIVYRAVETAINGISVENDTNGDYIVTYEYTDSSNQKNNTEAFGDRETTATNRMIYGFVNLSKSAAYLAKEIKGVTTEDTNVNLSGIVFDIYEGSYAENNISAKPYASNVKTDSNGNLIQNKGKYGDEEKYLIPGTYTLVEKETNADYSLWDNGITFKIGAGGTSEHGTAWIYTDGENTDYMSLKVEYVSSGNATHHFDDTCTPSNAIKPAYNLESRGVIEFIKTGENENTPLDTHDNAQGESAAYFGVYTDKGCTNQVAGMVASADNKTKFVLTNKTQDLNGTVSEVKVNGKYIPYLRKYGDGFTLLSGTYYIKELVAPAGYKLDSKVREAVISHIDKISADGTDISDVYASNNAKIDGTPEYKWTNIPNKVEIYKMDQYGRKLDLNGQYLVLSIENGSTLPGNVSSYNLYQDTEHNNNYISYNASDESWTITGLFDINKTYTLSEPENSVPEKNVVANPITFNVDESGKIINVSNAVVPDNDPTKARGDDYNSYYKSDADCNVIVMRDVSRYYKNVVLEKLDSITKAKIPYISFKLFKYEKYENGVYVNAESVLEDGVILTTDSNGQIDLSKIQNVKNLITGCEIKYGLEVGNYYFEEVERGASDKYRLLGKVRFRIEPKTSTSNNYDDYAEVVYEDYKGNQVLNDPVTKIPKKLYLKKVNKDSGLLENARFTLEYVSVNKNNGNGYIPDITYNCITGSDGMLYFANANWEKTENIVDISAKGTYTLKEVLAPEKYMTPTPAETITFRVNSDNEIVVVTRINAKSMYSFTTGEGIENGIAETNGEHDSLNLTVRNDETKVNISKLNDIVSDKKTKDQKNLKGEALTGAVLEIYEGTAASGNPVKTLQGASGYTVIGDLKENTIYTLHEASAPTGFMIAEDIYFALFGTTVNNQSQLYVWTGTSAPTSFDKSSSDWSKSVNLKNNVLTMVDEAIIAPVDAQKVVGDNSYTALEGAVFDVYAGNDKIGTAKSVDSGYLVWATIEDKAYAKKLIYNSDGKRITSADFLTVEGKTIILRQNDVNYRFTEIYAPDNAYNNDDSWEINITADNYKEYKTEDGYNSNLYADIIEANKNETNKTVSSLTARSNTANGDDLINPQYKSTVTLHKYDADEEANRAAIANAEFTLYRGSVAPENIYKKAYNNDSGVFTTDSNGDISITIPEKGTYILKETKAATGYKLDSNNKFEFTLQDKSNATDKAQRKYGYGEINVLKNNGDDVPNNRIKGSISLKKTDKDSGELLNGVVYILARTDIPASPTEYLLKAPVEVVTGKKYTAVQNSDTKEWSIVKANSGASDGMIIIEGLNWGTYTLTEKTELSGYIFDSTANTNTFNITNTNCTEVQTNSDTNVKNSVTFEKIRMLQDEFGITVGKNLAGAEFVVLDSNKANEVFFFPSKDATLDSQKTNKVVSGSDGKVTIYGLPTSPDGAVTYHLHEVTAPKGYKIQTEDIEFTIDRYGNVKVKNNETYTEMTNKTVTMQDEAIKIYLQKLGEAGTEQLSGAEFELTDVCTSDCDYKLADGQTKKSITVNGRTMIPIETVIGGHTYQLTETKAPDGYKSNAIVKFKVGVDGKITSLYSEGGFITSENSECASQDNADNPTITIKDELIKTKLIKLDSKDDTIKLQEVKFEISPTLNDSFNNNIAVKINGYDSSTNTITAVTDENGEIPLPDGLFIHDNKYLLKEIETIKGYYLGQEAKDGVILCVDKNGKFSIERLEKYKNRGTGDECLVSVNGDNNIVSKNMMTTSFELTKNVEGNMGDKKGEFNITMKVYEPNVTPNPDPSTIDNAIAVKTIKLKMGETYDSVTGINLDNQNIFGSDSIPVGAQLVIIEDNNLDYKAKVKITRTKGGTTEENYSNMKGVVVVTLNKSSDKLSIELINEKNVTIDVGVNVEKHTAFALIAIMIPTAWVFIRRRRKRNVVDIM